MEDDKKFILAAKAFRLFLIGSVICMLPGLLPSFLNNTEFVYDAVYMTSSLLTIVFFILSIFRISEALSA